MQDMQPRALRGDGTSSIVSWFSILWPSPQMGKLESMSSRDQLPFSPHLSQSISEVEMKLFEQVSLILRSQLGLRHLSLRVTRMGELEVCIILPVVISLMDQRGSPSVRQKVEMMLPTGQFNQDSPWGLDTFMLSMLLRMKQTLSIRVQNLSLHSLGSRHRQFAPFIRILEVSNGLPKKIEERLSCSLKPIPVLPLLVNILVSRLPELLCESLRLILRSGGSSCLRDSTRRGRPVWLPGSLRRGGADLGCGGAGLAKIASRQAPIYLLLQPSNCISESQYFQLPLLPSSPHSLRYRISFLPTPLIYINNKMHGFSSKLKDAQLDNPEDLPSTPRKRPLYLEDASPPPTIPSSHNRLKFKYTVIEKPRRSWVGGLAFIGWLFLVALLFYIGYCDKLRNLRVEASLEKQKCQEDYVKNKCEKGLKAIVQYCEEKKRCSESEVEELLMAKIDIGFLVGEIIKDFAEGAGLYVCIAGVLLVYALLRRPSARQVRKEYLQYCH